jgi:glucose repression regulatory protein TUP1
VWDVEQRSIFHTFHGHEHDVYGVDFAPSGRYVASCSADRTVRTWEMETRRQAGIFNAQGGLERTKFSPDGNLIFAGCIDGDVYVWNVLQGHLVTRLKGHQGSVYDIGFRSDGCFATASFDNTLKLWDQVRADVEEGPASHVLMDFKGYSDNTY